MSRSPLVASVDESETSVDLTFEFSPVMSGSALPDDFEVTLNLESGSTAGT